MRAGRQDTSDDGDVTLIAKPGSCVVACLFDPYVGVGGMNHFMLPPGAGEAERFGVQCMELLINALLRKGAKREHLVARLFGGARLDRESLDLGAANARFLTNFISNERISQGSGLLNPPTPIRVEFRPAFGKTKTLPLPDEAEAIFKAERTMTPEIVEEESGDLELF